MAEREGFEPSVDFEAYTRFPAVLLQPLGHLSGIFRTAGSHRAREYITSHSGRPQNWPEHVSHHVSAPGPPYGLVSCSAPPHSSTSLCRSLSRHPWRERAPIPLSRYGGALRVVPVLLYAARHFGGRPQHRSRGPSATGMSQRERTGTYSQRPPGAVLRSALCTVPCVRDFQAPMTLSSSSEVQDGSVTNELRQ